ncbi:hypothetical protein ACFWA9_15710 [Kitasatospora sp. NPDC059973]|uniref:hypothetical protein n=1 Tax=Kitasatospora sp. NPDC059973 TaxID=3347020 RepID=UPI00369E5BD1
MAGTWEQVLAFFGGADQKIVDRTKIAELPAGSKSWIRPESVQKGTSGANFYYGTAVDTGHTDMAKTGEARPDVWWAWNYTFNKVNHHVVIGIPVNYTDWGNDTDKPLSQFIHQHEGILGPLASGGGNGTVDPRSLRDAAQGLRDVGKWLETWYPRVRKWAELIDGPDSNWQGDAAGEFKMLLKRYALEIETIRLQLDTVKHPQDLEAAADQIPKTVTGLFTVHKGWWDSGDLWPSHAIYKALEEEMTGKKPEFDQNGQVTSIPSASLGDATQDAFYVKLEQKAKQKWLDNVVKYLDKRQAAGGADPTDALNTAYQKLVTDFGRGYVNATLDLPTQAPPGPGAGDGAGGDGKGGPGNPDLGGGAGGGGGGNSKLDLGAGGGGGGDGKGGGNNTHLPPPPPVISPGGGGGGGGGAGLGGDGAGTPILDKDHKPVLGADKKPVMLPPGGYIGKDGQVYDANGQKVTGKDGKPVVVPPGSDVPPGTGGGIYGQNAKVPKGSKVRDDGTVIGPDDKEVLDRDGNPVVLPKGGSIAGDGTLLDSTGRPISDISQRYTDRQHAIDAMVGSGSGSSGGGTGGGGGIRPPSTGSDWNLDLGSSFGDYGSGGSSTSASGGLGSYAGLFGGAGGTGLSSGGLSSGGLSSGGGSMPRLVSSGGGLSPQAIENSGGLAPGGKTAAVAAAEAAAAEKAATQKAAAMAAEEQAAMRGRSVSTSGGGMPMMPPMGGMGGGMGAGQGEKDRQRTTWLAEDEEVWGTETGAVDGVIGR